METPWHTSSSSPSPPLPPLSRSPPLLHPTTTRVGRASHSLSDQTKRFASSDRFYHEYVSTSPALLLTRCWTFRAAFSVPRVNPSQAAVPVLTQPFSSRWLSLLRSGPVVALRQCIGFVFTAVSRLAEEWSPLSFKLFSRASQHRYHTLADLLSTKRPGPLPLQQLAPPRLPPLPGTQLSALLV